MNFTMHLRLFLRSFFLQAAWNYMRFQNIGFAFVMLPVLKRIYKKDKDELPSVLVRYLENFNTHPVMASFCFGALAKQEEILAHEKSLPRYTEKIAAWKEIKRSFSITTASIGDRFFWGALKPFTLLIALMLWLCMGVNIFELSEAGSISYTQVFVALAVAFILFNSIALWVRWKGITLGYKYNAKACFGLTHFDWNRTTYWVKWAGMIFSCLMLGFAIIYFLRDFKDIDFRLVARMLLVFTCVVLSLISRRLRIANMYVYILMMIIFNIACFF